jgi:ribosome-associated protein
VPQAGQTRHHIPKSSDVIAPGVLSSDVAALHDTILKCLDTHKAFDIISIPLVGKSSIADVMVIASGSSNRQVAALADYVSEALKPLVSPLRVAGLPQADWVLLDAGSIIVHLFRPEVRNFYNLEKMWSVDGPTLHQA